LEIVRTYFRLVPPEPNTDVEISLIIEGISHLSAKTMDYDLSAFLRISWRDHRIGVSIFDNAQNSSFSNVESGVETRLWKPDIFFLNEKDYKSQYRTLHDPVMEISTNGTIVRTERISVTITCSMDLLFYKRSF